MVKVHKLNTLFYFTVAGLDYSETPFVFACLLE